MTSLQGALNNSGGAGIAKQRFPKQTESTDPWRTYFVQADVRVGLH